MFKVIGFNKNGTQTLLESAPTMYLLLKRYTQDVIRHESTGPHNILPTFVKIAVAENNVFTGLEIPYIPTIVEPAPAKFEGMVTEGDETFALYSNVVLD